ncbi:MAG: outer membrane beta-barrel protein [Bacteroidales bacterium]|nr:outer membrane beta-barrel protein [Bacteroidales bacterium]MBN2818095.1 outer membrane beta-barrel protein [Bacteroidales bacterium]
MSDKFENIDKLFEEELKNFSPELPEGAWENIAMVLSQSSAKKVVLFNFWKIAAGIALFLATAGIAGYLFFNQPSSVETVTDTDVNNPALEHKPESALIKANGERVNSIHQQNRKLAKQENKKTDSKLKQTVYAKSEEKNNKENSIIAENNEFAVVSSLNNNQTVPQPISPNSESVSESSDEIFITEETVSNEYQNNATEAQENLVWGSEEKGSSLNDGKWLIGGQAGPQYSYRTLSSDYYSEQALAPNNSSESGIVSFTGGVQVEYQTASRFSIQSGIYYSKLGIEQEAIPNYSTNIADPTSISYANNTARLDGSSKFMFPNSSVKIVAKNSTDAIGSSNEDLNNYNSYPATNMPAWRNYEYIEIPFLARYAIIDRKLALKLIGGFSTNVLISNKVAFNTKDNYTNFETADVNTVNYSSTLGLGFSYELSGTLVMSLEPQFKYFLNNQLYGDYIDLHPYSLGVFSGIKYSF